MTLWREVLVAFVLIGACARSGPEPSRPDTSQSVREGLVIDGGQRAADPIEAGAREVVAELARGDFAGATARFDETMRDALPEDRLGAVWRDVVWTVASFVAVERVRLADWRGYRIAFVRCRFERGERVVKLVYGSDARIAGFFILDAPKDTPWTPPPYARLDAFKERDVRIGQTPELPGILAMPEGAGPFPAVVLVHGSGPQDADETVGGVKMFRDLAFGLASRGVAVLRYVKRSRVDPRGVVTVKEEVIDPARAAIDRLAGTPGVDPRRIVVVGHSEGGYLSPRIARDDGRVAGLVILAGNTRPVQDLVVEQVRYLAALAPGAPAMQARIDEATRFKATVDEPALRPDATIATPGGGTATGAYFLDLRGYHPERVAAGLSCPMLVVRGERDYQVAQADFDGWKGALDAQPRVTLKQYPGLNHLFVAGTGPSTPAEYEQQRHVDAALIEDVARWIVAMAP